MTTSIRRLTALVLFTVYLTGCHTDPREDLLERVFEALELESAAAFMNATVTSSDFDLRAQGISPFKEHMTYLGSSVKPEQRTRQEAQFRRAVDGAAGQIDFSEDRFLGLGTLLVEVSQETLTGLHIPVSIYSARIRRGGAEVDSKRLFPRFAMVRWSETRYRLLDLVFAE